MFDGWIVGAFDPTVFKTKEFEVAHQHYKKGYKYPTHTHKLTTEINYIIKGSVIASGCKLSSGEIFVYSPGEKVSIKFTENTDLIVIKVPSTIGDKYRVD